MDVPGAILLKQASHDWGAAQQVSPCRPASGCEAKRTLNQYASGESKPEGPGWLGYETLRAEPASGDGAKAPGGSFPQVSTRTPLVP